jgi:hypothetical protein
MANIKIAPDGTKEAVEKTATKTVEVTIGIIKWAFIIIVSYISIVTFLGYLSAGTSFLTNVATLSVGGFWGFLFGYFGWRLGESIELFFNKKFRRNNNEESNNRK